MLLYKSNLHKSILLFILSLLYKINFVYLQQSLSFNSSIVAVHKALMIFSKDTLSHNSKPSKPPWLYQLYQTPVLFNNTSIKIPRTKL